MQNCQLPAALPFIASSPQRQNIQAQVKRSYPRNLCRMETAHVSRASCMSPAVAAPCPPTLSSWSHHPASTTPATTVTQPRHEAGLRLLCEWRLVTDLLTSQCRPATEQSDQAPAAARPGMQPDGCPAIVQTILDRSTISLNTHIWPGYNIF